jgi:hypothetical protein
VYRPGRYSSASPRWHTIVEPETNKDRRLSETVLAAPGGVGIGRVAGVSRSRCRFPSARPPSRRMSSAPSAALLLWSILDIVVRESRPQTLHQSADSPPYVTRSVSRFPRTKSLELWRIKLPQVELGVAILRIEGGDGQYLLSPETWLWPNSDESKPSAPQYSYLASVPLLVVFSTSMTAIKVREGVSQKPHAFPTHNAHTTFLPGSIVLPGGSGTRQRSIES